MAKPGLYKRVVTKEQPLKGEKKIYFVAETKEYQQELRPTELMKVKCGAAHFEILDGIVFIKVSSVKEIIENR